jgi:hypothetical protein
MNKAQRLFARASAAAITLAAPAIVFAQVRDNPFNRSQNYLANTRTASGVTGGSDLPSIIGSLINVVLGFLGIVLLFYVLRAGFLWMTAGGDDKQVTTAKNMIRDAVIGLVVIIAGFAISNFVLQQLVTVTNGP